MEDEGSGDYEEAEQSKMTTTELPSTEKAETQSDEDENTDEGQSDEMAAEPRNFNFGPGEEEEEALDDQVVIEAGEKSDEEVSFGIPPPAFWLWNGAAVFNPFANNAIDIEEEPATAENGFAEPVQQVGKVHHLI